MIMWALPQASYIGAHDEAGENHYCEVSKGPCKHGDSCPVGHHKKQKPAHHAGGDAPNQGGHAAHDSHDAHSGHSANKADKANDTEHKTAFTCHGSAGAHAAHSAVIPTSTNPPYMLTAYLAPSLEPVPRASEAMYRDIDMAPPVLPPRLV